MQLQCQREMNGRGYGVLSRPVGIVCKLLRVQRTGKTVLYVCHDSPFEALHDDESQCQGVLVIQAHH